MILKQYGIGVRLVPKFQTGHVEYSSIDSLENTSQPIASVSNTEWHKNLSDGIVENLSIAITENGVVTLESSGTIEQLNSYIKDGDNEIYSSVGLHTKYNNAKIFKRVNNKSYVYQEFDTNHNIATSIDSPLMSVKNIMGSNIYDVQFSSLNQHLGTLTVDDLPEVSIPKYFDTTKFCLTTKYFPILDEVKVYGKTALDVWVDITNDIYNVSGLTGEILIDRVDIVDAKIFYFLMPVMTSSSKNIFIDSTNDFIALDGTSNKIFMDFEYNTNELYLDTINNNKIELTCDSKHTGITSTSQIVVNGTKSKSFINDSKYTIAPSTSILDNVYLSELSGSTLPASDSIDSLDVVVFGKFSTNGSSRMVPLSIGAADIDAAYSATCITDVSLFQTILHTDNSPLPTELNGPIQYSLNIDFSVDGYKIPMPSTINLGSLVVTEDSGSGPVSYTQHTVINPNIVVFDRKLVNKNYTYNIQYTSLVSPIISIVDTHLKNIHLNISSDPFVHYNDLEGIYILSNNACSISFKNNFNLNSEMIFSNKFKFTITPTQKYIKASLSKYQALLFGTI